ISRIWRKRWRGSGGAGAGCGFIIKLSGPERRHHASDFEWQRGNKAAENALFEALYKRLHAKVHLLHSEPRGQSMGPTALVHEAYLRLERSERVGNNYHHRDTFF